MTNCLHLMHSFPSSFAFFAHSKQYIVLHVGHV